MKQLQQELQDALVVEGKAEADLSQNFNRRTEELSESYQKQIDDIAYGYKDTSKYKTDYAAYQKLLEKQRTAQSKGKSLSSSDQKKLDKYAAEMNALAEGATYTNINDFITAWSYVYDNQTKYLQGKLGKDAGKKYDKYAAQVKNWTQEKQDELRSLQNEMDDNLENLESEYETQVNENEKAINEQKEKLWETARAIAEFEVTSTQALIDSLDTVISRYEAVAHVLEETNFDALKKYGIMDLFNLDDAKDVSELLTEQLTNAINDSKEKVTTLVQQVGLYEELLDAADRGSFEAIFEKYRQQAGEEMSELIDNLITQLNENDFTDNTWVDDWNKALSDSLSEILDVTEAVENFKEELREKVLFAAITDNIEEADTLISKLESMSNIIKDEWVTDSVSGRLTEYGLAKINVLGQQLASAQDAVSNYAEKIRLIQEAQNDENTAYKDQAAYLKALREAQGEYYDSLVDVQNISDKIYQLGKQAQQSEIDSLKKLTDLRVKALQSKKAYYDYDRTIKKQTADVEALQAEIEALNGVNYFAPSILIAGKSLEL